jgi:hypothetical protein
MGHSNSKLNSVDATNEVTQEIYNKLKNTLNVEAKIDSTFIQKINVNPPPVTKCDFTLINENVSEQTIMQTASADTLNSLAAGLNSKVDDSINQLNQDGADAMFSFFGRASKTKNYIKTINTLKNEIHNSISNAVNACSNIMTSVEQEINFNVQDIAPGVPDRFPQSFSCGSAFFENSSRSKAQIGQVATSIVKNVAGIKTISDDTLNAVQTNTGFLGDLVTTWGSITTKIMYVVIVVAIVGLIITAAGGLFYFTTRPSHPRSSDSLLDGITNSLN